VDAGEKIPSGERKSLGVFHQGGRAGYERRREKLFQRPGRQKERDPPPAAQECQKADLDSEGEIKRNGNSTREEFIVKTVPSIDMEKGIAKNTAPEIEVALPQGRGARVGIYSPKRLCRYEKPKNIL